MPLLKSVCFLFLLLLTSSSILFAQPPGDRLQRQLDRLAQQLELTEAQRQKLDTIRTEQVAKLQAMREAQSEGERKREDMRALLRESRQRMLTVLTPEQDAQLAELRKSRRPRQTAAQRQAMQAELKQYREAEILPDLRQLRTTFDAKLSEQERSTIQTLREATTESFGSRGLHRVSRADLRQFKQAHQPQLAAVREVAQAHQSELEAIRVALRQNRTRWRQESRAIRAKYQAAPPAPPQPPSPLEAPASPPTPPAPGANERSRSKTGHRNRRGNLGALTFLLLDPTAIQTSDADAFDETGGILLYPNPAQGATRVVFETATSGDVQIHSVDAAGRNTLLYSGRLEAGSQDIEVQLPADLGNTAVLQVVDGSGVRSASVARQ